MSKRTLISALVAAGVLLPAAARKYPAVTFVQQPQAEWRGDSLALSFRAQVDGKLKGAESIEVVPVYFWNGDTLRFPSVLFTTSSEAKYRHRRDALGRGGDAAIVVTQGRRGFAPFDYSRRLVSPRLRRGDLQLMTVLRTCCDSMVTSSVDVPVGEGPVFYASDVSRKDSRFIVEGSLPEPCVEMPCSDLPSPVVKVPLELWEGNVSLFFPLPEERKQRSGDTSMHLNYPVNGSKINRAYNGNESELSRLDEMLVPIAENPGSYRISGISITGYASPEDSYDHNLELSQRRADGLKEYIVSEYGIDPRLVSSVGMGEDWEGLREAILGSDVPAKGDILDIIDGVGIFDGREKILMDLKGGDPYKYMMKHLYPRLRRLEAKVDYSVRPWAEEELDEVIATRPSDMSLNEMWQVARDNNNDSTIKERRLTYGGEYYVMARFFPESDVANLNASSAALIRGHLAEARRYLSMVSESPLAANNIGLYYWMCGMPAEARAYFNIAMLVDPERARRNLSELERWEAGDR